jgi:ABC-type branched-subunit amino acid transport system substrate-binding protein
MIGFDGGSKRGVGLCMPAVIAAMTCLGLSCACSSSGQARTGDAPPTKMPDRGSRAAATPADGPETKEYRAGLRHLRAGDWGRAAESFRLFQSEHPQHDKATFAELYIARAYLGELPPWGKSIDRKPNHRQTESAKSGEGGPGEKTRSAAGPIEQGISMLRSLATGHRNDVVSQAATLYLVYALNRRDSPDKELISRLQTLHPDMSDAAVFPMDRPAVLSGVLSATEAADTDKNGDTSDSPQHVAPRVTIRLADRLFTAVTDTDRIDHELQQPATGAPANSTEEGAQSGTANQSSTPTNSTGAERESQFTAPTDETDRMLVSYARDVAFEAADAVEFADDWVWPTDDQSGPLERAALGWGRATTSLSADNPDVESLQSLLDNTTRALRQVGADGRITELAVYRATAGDSGPMVLAAVVPWSGANASIGERAVDGMMLALDVFEGRQVSRVTVEVVDATKSADRIRRRLKQIDASIVLGPLDQERARRLAPVARDLDVPMMPMTTQPVAVAEPGTRPTMLRNFLDPVAEAKVAARAAFNRRGNRSVAIVYPDNGYGNTMRETFKKEFRSLGGRVPLERAYNRKTSDYSSAASAVADASVDGVFIPGAASNVAELSAFIAQENVWGEAPEREIDEQRGGTRIDYIGTSLWVDSVLPRQAASYLGEPVIPVWYAPGLDDDDARRFTRRFQSAFDRRAQNVEAFAYDSVTWIRQFVIRRGIRRPASLMKTLTSGVKLRGATGAVRFSANAQTRSIRFVTLSKTGFKSMGFAIDVELTSARNREETKQRRDTSTLTEDMSDEQGGQPDDSTPPDSDRGLQDNDDESSEPTTPDGDE